MRLLHTSDLHLGRSLHRADLRPAQERVVDALVETVATERIDVVLIAGDVYDRAVPPVESVRLFEDALVRLTAAGARVVVSSGNHDSATRLGFGGRLLETARVHLRTRPETLAEPVLVEDAHGPVGIYALPYLEPDAVRGALPPVGGASTASDDSAARHGHEGVLRHATAAVRADAATRGLRRTVVTAHAWVNGGAASDSERDITVGGVSCVSAALFAPFDYAALGHLHGRQVIDDHIRYSGSPLAYSFSEADHRKGSWLVELGAHGTSRVEFVPAPMPRRLRTVRGELAQLLTSADYTPAQDCFLAVTLTDVSRPVDAMDRLRARFPYLLTIAWDPAGIANTDGSYGTRVRGKDDLAIAAAFVEHVRRSAPAEDEQTLLRDALEAVRVRADDETAPAHAASGAC